LLLVRLCVVCFWCLDGGKNKKKSESNCRYLLKVMCFFTTISPLKCRANIFCFVFWGNQFFKKGERKKRKTHKNGGRRFFRFPLYDLEREAFLRGGDLERDLRRRSSRRSSRSRPRSRSRSLLRFLNTNTLFWFLSLFVSLCSNLLSFSSLCCCFLSK